MNMPRTFQFSNIHECKGWGSENIERTVKKRSKLDSDRFETSCAKSVNNGAPTGGEGDSNGDVKATRGWRPWSARIWPER